MRIGKKASNVASKMRSVINIGLLTVFVAEMIIVVTSQGSFSIITISLVMYFLLLLFVVGFITRLIQYIPIDGELRRHYVLRVVRVFSEEVSWLFSILSLVVAALLLLTRATLLNSVLLTILSFAVYIAYIIFLWEFFEKRLERMFTDRFNEHTIKKAIQQRRRVSKLGGPAIEELAPNVILPKSGYLRTLWGDIPSDKLDLSSCFWLETFPSLSAVAEKMGLKEFARVGTCWVYFRKKFLFLNINLVRVEILSSSVCVFTGLCGKKASKIFCS